MFNSRSKLIILVILILEVPIFMSCEKEIIEDPSKQNNNSNLVDIDRNEPIINNSKGNSNSISVQNPLPYIFLWQRETTVDLGGDCGCLPTVDGDCFPMFTFVGGAPLAEYDIFISYYNSNDVVSYFEDENWGDLLPMIEQSTIDLILNHELKLWHNYNTTNDVGFFVFVDSQDQTNIEVVTRLQF